MASSNQESSPSEKLSIIIPIFNEEKSLPLILEKVKAISLPIEKEIILVDDMSTDGSRAFLSSITDCKVFFNEKNMGKGASVRKGLANATGTILTIQDADLEYNPQELALLLDPILKKECEVVFGSRFMHKDARKKTLFLKFYYGNRMLSLFTSIMYGRWISDMETCYKMFTRNAYSKINLTAMRFDLEPEITASFLRKGFKIKEVPISYDPRNFEEGKKIGVKDGIVALLVLLKLRFKRL